MYHTSSYNHMALFWTSNSWASQRCLVTLYSCIKSTPSWKVDAAGWWITVPKYEIVSLLVDFPPLDWTLWTCRLAGLHHLLRHPVRLQQPLFQMRAGLPEQFIPSTQARFERRDQQTLHQPGPAAGPRAGTWLGSQGREQQQWCDQTERRTCPRLIIHLNT